MNPSGINFKKTVPIKKLLTLTTKNVLDRILVIGSEEAGLSCGLADLINKYTGGQKCQRQQKLFPNLSIDNLEDHFHRASKKIFPSQATPALPEAFLTFPHTIKGGRVPAKTRQLQKEKLPPIIHDPNPRRELRKHLVKAFKKKIS